MHRGRREGMEALNIGIARRTGRDKGTTPTHVRSPSPILWAVRGREGKFLEQELIFVGGRFVD
jgi:hypothetical protein